METVIGLLAIIVLFFVVPFVFVVAFATARVRRQLLAEERAEASTDDAPSD